MAREFTTDDLASLLESLAAATPGCSVQLHPGYIHCDWDGVPVDARVTGSTLGRRVVALSSSLGSCADIDARVPLARVLAHVASAAATRAVVDGEALILETRAVPDDLDGDLGRIAAVLAWHMTELCTFARAWRRNLDLDVSEPLGLGDIRSLAELIQTTPVPPGKALLVATVGFAVAGADGRVSSAESAMLRAWMRDIPSFAALDLHRVIDAIATLVDDPARTLLEALRRLEHRERLLAWALANEMAHADGFTPEDALRYLSTVASIFHLTPRDVAPFAVDAQARAIRRETLVPPASGTDLGDGGAGMLPPEMS